MADILIQPAVPSLFPHTESASSLIVDSPTADSNNNITIHHSHLSPNHTNNHINNRNNNPHTANKYIGHVSRLRSVFTQQALLLNDLKSGEHRSRYSNHHNQGLGSPTRGSADGAEDRSLSPPLPPLSLPLATTSSSTIIERSRSLSNPRILDNTASSMHAMRSGLSSLTVNENQAVPIPAGLSSSSNDDHALRFRKAKEMFQTLEEEAARTVVSSSSLITTKPSVNHRAHDHFSNEIYQPDLMHEGSKILLPKVNTEHIPDLIIDHRQQQQKHGELHDSSSNRIREIPVQIIGTTSSPSPTSSDRSYISVPIHRTTSPIQPPTSSLTSDDGSYAIINRKEFHPDQHYDFPKESINDFPPNAVEQQQKHHRRQIDENLIHQASKPSNEEIANRIVASILPSNILKRMDHLNTKFIRPATIDHSLPRLSFAENGVEQSVGTDEDTSQNYQTIESIDTEQKWIENPILNVDTNLAQSSSRSSSPIFYEKPGLPQLNDESAVSPSSSRRVKFSNDPIRVYPTYSPSEYNRRNDDIDPFSASAEYELEKRIEKMHVFEVEIQKGPDGLGISVLGMGVGADSGLEKLGIFVKSLNPQGVIARDGRIQVGDQIIEVGDHSLVGVTHTYATSVLKATSGLVRFVIGREKDMENSEILRLIQQSLQMDQERNEMTRALQNHPDNFNERHLSDDGFPNLELNDHDDQETSTDNTLKTNHHPFPGIQEKNYDSWPETEKIGFNQNDDLHQFEILKQRYESLENTLANVEKEKQYYQDLYEQTKKDLEHIEEKYLKAKKLIKELQDRETELREKQTEQSECNEYQQKRIKELTKKTEELERAMANSVNHMERIAENSSLLHRSSKYPSTSSECVVSRPPDIPERIPIRSRTSSGQAIITVERPPSRNTPATSSVRLPSTSLDKISNPNINYKSNHQSDFEVDRSPLLNHSVQIDKSQLAKTRPKHLPSKRLSNSLSNEENNQNDEIDSKTSNAKHPSTEYITKIPTESQPSVSDEYIEVKDWTLDQCIQWLTAQEMTSFIPIFLNRNIDGEKLLLLDSSKMKTMGIKSSKDRDQLKMKLKELKHAELDRTRERLLTQHATTFQHAAHSGNRLRSSSMTKLRERRLFGGSGGK